VRIHLPAVGPTLPIHPRTGLTALGLRRNGAPIWPVRGGSGDGDNAGDGGDGTGDSTGADGDGNDDGSPDGLGDAGKKAIAAMKAERNAARKELQTVRTQLDELAPLKKLAEALGGKSTGDGKTDMEALTERLTQHEVELTKERQARYRAEVAAEKKLTPAQAKRLVGVTKDELLADADEIIQVFPIAQDDDKGRKGPKPDRSQGSRGGAPLSGREAGLAEAQKRFGKPAATQNTR
jgi:hypothetical protein